MAVPLVNCKMAVYQGNWKKMRHCIPQEVTRMVESKADTFSALIGKKIHVCRVQADLSLRALGDKINVDNSTLAKIEKGTVRPTIDVLNRVAQALLVHVSYFVDPELQAPPLLGSVTRGGWSDQIRIARQKRRSSLFFPS
jgi:transcriptional regulator with XRE-family HTH domain